MGYEIHGNFRSHFSHLHKIFYRPSDTDFSSDYEGFTISFKRDLGSTQDFDHAYEAIVTQRDRQSKEQFERFRLLSKEEQMDYLSRLQSSVSLSGVAAVYNVPYGLLLDHFLDRLSSELFDLEALKNSGVFSIRVEEIGSGLTARKARALLTKKGAELQSNLADLKAVQNLLIQERKRVFQEFPREHMKESVQYFLEAGGSKEEVVKKIHDIPGGLSLLEGIFKELNQEGHE